MENGHLLGSMQVFISVVDSGSFSECARRMGLSQPSVSRQINLLESHLGVRLIQRSTRSLSLTEAGQIYYEKARFIQHSVIEAGQSISGFKESPSGVLKIAAPFTWTEEKIAPHLGEFMSQYPDIKLDIHCNDSIQDLVKDQLDLVIRVGLAVDSSFIAIPFGHVRLVLCASPDYIKSYGEPKTISDLNNHQFITFNGHDKFLWQFGDDHHELKVPIKLSTNSVNVMINSVKQHIGLSVLPDLLIQEDLHHKRLIEVMPEWSVSIKNFPVSQVFALYSSRQHMPAKVRAFIDFFKSKFN